MAILWIVPGGDVVEMGALERIFFEGEVFVGAQVVDPELLRPRFFRCWFAVEDEAVGLYTLSVENAGRQAQQGVNVGLFQ